MWYSNYDGLKEGLAAVRLRFFETCKEKELEENAVIAGFYRDLTAKAVYESNWQEGVKLERGKTQRFSNMAFDEIGTFTGPSLDLDAILKIHQKLVRGIFKKGGSMEEVGAFNLASSYTYMTAIRAEMARKATVVMIKEAAEFALTAQSDYSHLSSYQDLMLSIEDAKRQVSESERIIPFVKSCDGGILKGLMDIEIEELRAPFSQKHLHFLHRVTMMGLLPPKECGRLRRIGVHVGHDGVLFPPPEAIEPMLDRFCKSMPSAIPDGDDIVRLSAVLSHRFVSIHPYVDGNGRVSRVIMNGVLCGRHPPVALKADKKGSKRYGQALARADRGNLEPLAALICKSLIESYESMIRAISH